MTECSVCLTNFHLWTVGATDVRCVKDCQTGMFNDVHANGTLICTDCITDCLKCSSATTCSRCAIGKVSQNTGVADACQASCDTGYFDQHGV